MALFKFTKGNDRKAKYSMFYNYGKMKRDFTYIDDIAEAYSAPTGCHPLRADEN